MIDNINKTQKSFLTKLNKHDPLANFCEYLEETTNGQFTFNTFQQELKSKYQKTLTESEYKTFFQNIYLDDLQITTKCPYINIYSLFDYFSEILSLKIVSPILSIYSMINQIRKKRTYPSLDSYLSKIKSKFGNLKDINIVKFDTIFVKHKNGQNEEYMVDLDSVDVVCIFKALNYNKQNKIQFNDICALIESYYDEDDLNADLSENDIKGELFKTLISKYSIDLLKDVFKGQKEKGFEMKELITKIKDIMKLEIRDKKIIDTILNFFFYNILEKTKRKDDAPISYNDIENELKAIQTKSRKHKIYLSDFQRDNIQKYLNHLQSLDVSTELMFQYSMGNNKKEKIDLDSLKNQLSYLLRKNPDFDMNEIQNIRDAFDYNKKGTLTRKEYNKILTEVQNKKEISVLQKYNIPHDKHYLFPIKGNSSRYKELQKEINRLVFLNSEQYHEHIELNIEDYQDDEFVIAALEKVDFEYPHITCHDLMIYLNNTGEHLYKRPKKNTIKKVIMLIDTNQDGYVSGLDIINFMLSYLQHKSGIIARKYIIKKVRYDHDVTLSNFVKENYKDYSRKTILSSKDISEFFYKHFEIPQTVTKKMVKEFKTFTREPFLLDDFIYLFEEANNELKDNSTEFLEESFEEMDIQHFEESLSKMVCSLIDMNSFYLENSSKTNSSDLMKITFDANLNTALKIHNPKGDTKYSYQDYKRLFIQPLKLDIHLGNIIYHLLKTENEDCIYLSNIKSFLYAFLPPIQTKSTNELIELFNKNGRNIKQPIESLLFNKEGIVSILELMNVFLQYYPRFDKKLLKQVVSAIDVKKNGFVSYRDIQVFFKEHLQINNFSYIIELKHIMSKLFSKGSIKYSSEEYFYSEESKEGINDCTKVQRDEHNNIFEEFCEDQSILNDFYESILSKQGRYDGYDIKLLCDDLNYYSCSVHNDE